MKILFVSATKDESDIFSNRSQLVESSLPCLFYFDYEKTRHSLLISGVGLVSTTYWLEKILASESFDLVINTGIAGAFTEELNITEVVIVSEDEFADFGIQDTSGFKTLFETGLLHPFQFPFINGKLIPVSKVNFQSLKLLKKVKGITCSTAHGDLSTIRNIKDKFRPDIETMEGAAVMYVCASEKIPCLQIRAISNKVEARNKAIWNIEGALQNLEKVIVDLLNEIVTL